MNKLSLRIGLISLSVAGAAASQAYDFVNLRAPNTGGQQNIVQQGVFEAGVAGSFTSTSVSGGGSSVTNSTLLLNAGYFVTGNIEIFGNLSYMGVSGGGGGSNNTTLFEIGGRYYFGVKQDTQVLPFAGIFVGAGQTTGSSNVTAYGGEIGIHYFFAPQVSVTPVLKYTGLHASGVNANQFGLELGLNVWFK